MAELASTILAIAGGIDVLARTSLAISKLIGQWRDAPASVTSLAEEVRYLHDATIRLKGFAAELQLRECYVGEKGEKHERNSPYITVLIDLVRRAEPFLEQLRVVIYDMEKYSRRQTLSLKWMRVAGRVDVLRAELRNLRLDTVEVLSVYSASQGLRIESCIMAYQREQRLWSDSMTRSLTSIMTSLEDASQRTVDQTTCHTLPGSKVPLEEWPWEHPDHAGVPATQAMLTTVEPLDVPVSSCGPRCRCRCHVGRKRGQFRVAPFQSVLGSVSIIFFGWTLMGPRCSVLSCQKARVKFLQVTYSTPFKPLGMSVVVSARFDDGKPSLGVSLGVTAHVTDEHNSMSIFAFVRGRKLPELKQMLQRRPGAVMDVSYRQGFSSLHYAFQLESAETIKILLAAGADPFLEDFWGLPAIYDALVRILQPRESTREKDEDEMKEALPISIFLDEYNFTHIHRVVIGSRPLRLEDALDHGLYSADVNAQDDMGMTPLHWAALKSDSDAVALLLSAGADVNVRNKRGRTALWKACLVNSETCAGKLIEFGAEVNAGCNYGYRPIHAAAQSDAGGDLLSLLLSNGADLEDSQNTFGRTPLARAISFDNPRTCKYLLECGANPLHEDRDGVTPIFEAIVKNSHDCLELLLSLKVDYLYKSRNQTLLHVAAMRGDGRTFEILAKARLSGLEINARDNNSKTARQLFAARSGVPPDTAASFESLIRSLTATRVEACYREEESSDEEDFVDALEYVRD